MPVGMEKVAPLKAGHFVEAKRGAKFYDAEVLDFTDKDVKVKHGYSKAEVAKSQRQCLQG